MDIYHSDYAAWAKQQIKLLHQGRFTELDCAHLIQELDEMGRSERNELENRLVILLAHLLKWQFQYALLSERWQEFKGDSWRSTIIEQRDRIQRRLDKSPGLQSALEELITEAYQDARRLATKETGQILDQYPAQCPYTKTQILDDDFYPETNYSHIFTE